MTATDPAFDLPSLDTGCTPPCPAQARCERCFTTEIWADELNRLAAVFCRSGRMEDWEEMTVWMESPPWGTVRVAACPCGAPVRNRFATTCLDCMEDA